MAGLRGGLISIFFDVHHGNMCLEFHAIVCFEMVYIISNPTSVVDFRHLENRLFLSQLDKANVERMQSVVCKTTPRSSMTDVSEAIIHAESW